MNETIEHLIKSSKLTPPPLVETEEDVVEWLLDVVEDYEDEVKQLKIDIESLEDKYGDG